MQSLTLESFDGDDSLRVDGAVFIEATYEGDLAAVAGVPCRVGRESRTECGEQFAGRIFTRARGDRYYPREAVGSGDSIVPDDLRGPLDVPDESRRGGLDLVPHPGGLSEICPGSAGTGDDAIQAYNFRLCLSRNPDNRRRPEKPPGYDRSEYLDALEEIESSGLRSYLLLRHLPNEKADMNSADLPGENHEYPSGDWDTPREIARRHREYALGLLYFLQNGDTVPDEVQTEAREWGLALDEFVGNDNFPWQLYVREAHRIEGRYTFTENDARYAPGLDRTPIHHDAIAFAEYPLDSHSCTSEQRSGSRSEGFFFATQVTRPSQVPYRAILPKQIDNLLVPVPLSATHVGHGTIRLEPTWMHIGEAAGFAAAQALEQGVPPANIDVSRLQRTLVEAGHMLSFFNEFDMETKEPWVSAVQYFGTKEFFSSYDARPEDPLTESAATRWLESANRLMSDEFDTTDPCPRRLPDVDSGGDPITASTFATLVTESTPTSKLPSKT